MNDPTSNFKTVELGLCMAQPFGMNWRFRLHLCVHLDDVLLRNVYALLPQHRDEVLDFLAGHDAPTPPPQRVA